MAMRIEKQKKTLNYDSKEIVQSHVRLALRPPNKARPRHHSLGRFLTWSFVPVENEMHPIAKPKEPHCALASAEIHPAETSAGSGMHFRIV